VHPPRGRVMREREELAAALRVAEHGLTLEGRKGELAAWLCDLVDGMGETARALEAATVAFQELPSMAAYQRVQELAGERWPELREDLLAHLRRASDYSCSQAQVNVFLHEGLLDDAIAAVEKGAGYDLLECVMDAVVECRPKRVIGAARTSGAHHLSWTVQVLPPRGELADTSAYGLPIRRSRGRLAGVPGRDPRPPRPQAQVDAHTGGIQIGRKRRRDTPEENQTILRFAEFLLEWQRAPVDARPARRGVSMGLVCDVGNLLIAGDTLRKVPVDVQAFVVDSTGPGRFAAISPLGSKR
jgi:hypothetical protein